MMLIFLFKWASKEFSVEIANLSATIKPKKGFDVFVLVIAAGHIELKMKLRYHRS